MLLFARRFGVLCCTAMRLRLFACLNACAWLIKKNMGAKRGEGWYVRHCGQP